MKLLLLTLLLPAALFSQEVTPVISTDYLSLINNDSLAARKYFSTDTFSKQKTIGDYRYYGGAVKKIIASNNEVILAPLKKTYLRISGTFNSTFEHKYINRQPALQSQYAQGRSQNGSLVWRGAETNELFSYGPALQALEYDGSNYAYDVNGRLVTAGTGNGRKALAYNNTILRPATLFSESIHTQWKLMTAGTEKMSGHFKWQQSNEKTFIKNNNNRLTYFSGSLQGIVKKHTIGGSYNSTQECFSYTNRNGFLNQVYQQALLTPVSFNNANGLPYSNGASNSNSLLYNNDHGFYQTHKTGSLTIGNRLSQLDYSVIQSLENLQQQSKEIDGNPVIRNKKDQNYTLRETANYKDLRFGNDFRSQLGLNYNYNNRLSTIQYEPGNAYRYQRSSHDLAFTSLTIYDGDGTTVGLSLGNKLYASNTANSRYYWLPTAAGFIVFNDLLPALWSKFTAKVDNACSELPIDQSLAGYNLLQYNTSQSLQYAPIKEVTGFDNMAAIRYREYMGRAEFFYKYGLSLWTTFLKRQTFDDVFPVINNSALVLNNLANHQNNSIELGLAWNSSNNKRLINTTLSFFANRTKVTQVKSGYNYTPLAGFADVHTALVEGQPLGVLVGSHYQTAANGQVLIGTDGFPLVNPTPAIIGNPNPDFIIKSSNSFTWKNWFVNIACEWKKGGVVWNGTQAVLDYYGRSANSGNQRTTTGYVFEGVLPNGHVNDIPVSFYDASQPIDNNRWTRYGYSGVASNYIQRADYLAIHDIGISYTFKKVLPLQKIVIRAYVNNILLWTPYKGADPRQLMYDQLNASGLDYFNLPTLQSFGGSASIQF